MRSIAELALTETRLEPPGSTAPLVAAWTEGPLPEGRDPDRICPATLPSPERTAAR